MWAFIFLGFSIVTLLGFFYIWTRFQKFDFIKKLSGDKKWKRRLLGAIPTIGIIVYIAFDIIPGVVAFVHLLIIWVAVEFVVKLINKKKDNKSRIYWPGILALSINAVYLTIAFYLATTVVQVDYTIETDRLKDDEGIRVVMFADSHIGATFDGEGMAEYIREMGKLKPDLVVIVGDYVDDDTKRIDMETATRAFSEISPTFGVYYVFGNHDKGYGFGRNFNAADLVNTLEENGVKVLEDEVIELTDKITLIGRQDRSVKDRADISDLMEGIEDKYTIVLNHQPNDQKAEKAAGADLVLSGHTHGGQLLPINYMGEFFGLNDQTKGIRVLEDSTFIVTSGISDWAIPFKTGCRAEYLVIDIK